MSDRKKYDVPDKVLSTWNEEDLNCYIKWRDHIDKTDGVAIPMTLTVNFLKYLVEYRQMHQRPNILPGEPIRNRPLNIKRCERYTSLIRRGKWLYNMADTIAFLPGGYEFDGKTRKHAFIAANVSYKALVCNNADINSFNGKDFGGKPKIAGDWFHSNEIPNSTNIAAASAMAFRLVRTQRANRPVPSKSFSLVRTEETIEYYCDGNQEISKSYSIAKKINMARTFECTLSNLMALHYLYSKINAAKADEIFNALAEHKITGKFKVLGTYMRALNHIQEATGLSLSKIATTDKMFVLIKALNLYFLTEKQYGTAKSISYIKNTYDPVPILGKLKCD